MPSNFQSFDQSPLGAFSQSALKARGGIEEAAARGVYFNNHIYTQEPGNDGVSSNTKFIFSIWLNPDEFLNASVGNIFGQINSTTFSFGDGIWLTKVKTANPLQGTVALSTWTNPFFAQLRFSLTVLYDQWHHIVCSIDVNDIANSQVYHNDSAGTVSGASTTNSVIAESAIIQIGENYKGCIQDVFVEYGSLLDLDVTANRRKFIKSDLTPADMGATGQNPLGYTPHIYFKRTTDWNNRGTTGAYVNTIGPEPSECSK